MGNRVMVRPDGSTVTVPDTDAEKLATLGYAEQTPQAELEAGIAAGQEAHYSTPLQKFLTFSEGGDSGFSLGLSDVLFGNEDSRERARVNAPYRIGGEIAGTIAATLVPGVGLLKYTPAGALARGAEVAGEAIGGGSKVINAMVRGSVEGAGFGAGQAITTAQLDGSPLTAEAILAGMGQGALWGGGLGAFGGAIEAKMARSADKAAAAESAITKGEMEAAEASSLAHREYKAVQGLADSAVDSAAKAGKLEEEGYTKMASTIQDAAAQLKDIKVQANEAVKEIKFDKLEGMQNRVYSQLVDNGNLHYVRSESRAALKEFSMAQLAAKEGKFEKMSGHLERFKEQMVTMQVKLGGPKIYDATKMVDEANNLVGLAKYRVDTATKAAEDMANITAVHSTLSAFPKNLAEFQGMTPGRLEKLSAGVEALGKIDLAELQGVKAAVKEAVTELGANLGVTMEGSPGAQLQGLWKIMKEGKSARVQEMLERGKQGNLLWEKYNKASGELGKAKKVAEEERKITKGMSATERAMYRSAQYGAGAWTAKKLGIGYGGYILGSGLVAGLVGLKGAVLGTISEKAATYLPKAAKFTQKYGSRVEPLATRLDGTMENEKKSREQLFETRKREIAEAAPAIRDTMYRAVQPLSIEHPELAVALHQLTIQRFQYILSKLPKDPGLAFSNLKSLWKADRVQMEKFARYYEAYHDPVGVINRALDTGRITPEAAEGVRDMNPELWTHYRAALLERVSDPEVMKDVTYNDQVQLGLMTGITFHASMDPRFIASTQQMFTERNQPLEMKPQTQPGGGAGRPAATSPGATSAQRNTEH